MAHNGGYFTCSSVKWLFKMWPCQYCLILSIGNSITCLFTKYCFFYLLNYIIKKGWWRIFLIFTSVVIRFFDGKGTLQTVRYMYSSCKFLWFVEEFLSGILEECWQNRNRLLSVGDISTSEKLWWYFSFDNLHSHSINYASKKSYIVINLLNVYGFKFLNKTNWVGRINRKFK